MGHFRTQIFAVFKRKWVERCGVETETASQASCQKYFRKEIKTQTRHLHTFWNLLKLFVPLSCTRQEKCLLFPAWLFSWGQFSVFLDWFVLYLIFSGLYYPFLYPPPPYCPCNSSLPVFVRPQGCDIRNREKNEASVRQLYESWGAAGLMPFLCSSIFACGVFLHHLGLYCGLWVH